MTLFAEGTFMTDNSSSDYQSNVRDILASTHAVLVQVRTTLDDIDILKLDSLIDEVSGNGRELDNVCQGIDKQNATLNDISYALKEILQSVDYVYGTLREREDPKHQEEWKKDITRTLNDIDETVTLNLRDIARASDEAADRSDKIVDALSDVGISLRKVGYDLWESQIISTLLMSGGMIFIIGPLRHWF